jgi:hypothetical protein
MNTFDWQFYLDKYHDLRKNGVQTKEEAKQHWITFGEKEGRVCLNDPFFDWQYYLDKYPDLKPSGIRTIHQAKEHWINFGKKEGRTSSSIKLYDWQFYLDKYPDLRKNGINTEEDAKEHWINFGQSEGRQYNKIPIKYFKDISNVFVFCGGKCGSMTLTKTLNNNGDKSIHLHSNYDYNRNIPDKPLIFDVIGESCKVYETVYIIDSYRTPIERKISSFFHHIAGYQPNYKNAPIQELVDFFNNNLLYTTEEYHSINDVLNYYNVPLFTSFNFKKHYNIKKVNNKIFIKILFRDIKHWGKYLSEIFNKPITMHSENLTEKKDTNDLYKVFKKHYKVPKNYINNFLSKDKEFKIYNTPNEQAEYIQMWLAKSY